MTAQPKIRTRHSMSKAATAITTATLLALLLPTASYAAYNVTNIGAILGTNVSSIPFGLNSSGQVVGQIQSAPGVSFSYLPFVYTPGAGVTVLSSQTTPSSNTGAFGINDSGLVVGTNSNSSATVFSGFTYNPSSSTYTTITGQTDTTGKINLAFKGINNSGVAAGYGSTTGNSGYRGVTYDTTSSTLTDVGTGFSTSSSFVNYGFAINSSGTYVGYGPPAANNNNINHPYVATPNGSGGYTYLDLQPILAAAIPGFANSTGLAMGLDSLGDVVGSMTDQSLFRSPGVAYLYKADGSVVAVAGLVRSSAFGVASVGGSPEVVGTASSHAFVWYNGTYTDLSAVVPGYTLDNAYAINSNGDIVASGTANGTSIEQAFLLSVAVPEPTSLSMLALGGVYLLRRRKQVTR